MKITAAGAGRRLTMAFGDQAITASATARTVAGIGVKYGVYGRTSVGRLKVRDINSLRYPADLSRVKLTKEHDRATSRGVLAGLEHTPDGTRPTFRVADGPDGDAAIREAKDGTRDALSFDIVDARIEGDEIVDGLVIAFGQVGIPAFDDARIDTIAASAAASTGRNTMLSPEQAQRLLELQAQVDNGQTLSDDDQKEFDALKTLSALQHAAPDTAAGDGVSASTGDQGGIHVHLHNGQASATTEVQASAIPAVPAGVPAPATSDTKATPRGGAYGKMLNDLTAAMKGGFKRGSVADITAALTDVTNTAVVDDIEPGEWAGELWSGLQYVPQFSDLFVNSSLTYWKGKGWRFTTTPAMQAYAGDKAAIPSGAVTTEDDDWEAAREAVGLDLDRKFYDFGVDQQFLDGLFQKIRETWAIRLDAHIEAYMASKAVAATRVVSATRTNADATVVSAAGAANVFKASDVGAAITGTGIPASTTILSVTDAHTIELSANASASGTSNLTIVTQESTVLKAAARASLVLKRRRVGAASWIYLNDEDMFSLLDINANAIPAFLDLYDIKPGDFRSSPDIPQGTVWAGVKQAAEVKTLPGSPIRVSAQNIVNGGVDEAFFGYWAIQEHHTSGIAAVTFKPAA